jgi:hypothetical protein
VRTKRIRRFAENESLAYIGSTMPVTLPLQRTRAFASARSLRRAVVGSNGDKELILVDCTIKQGLTGGRRTIVSMRGLHDGFGRAPYKPDFSTEQLDEWSVVYSSNRYMSLEEIDALVAAFSGPEAHS